MEMLKTKRLTLRPYVESDREQVVSILRNEQVSESFMLPDFRDDATAGKLFDRLVSLSLSGDHFERAVCLDDTVIGFVNDVEIHNGTVELGYVIHPDYWGRGYATEALTASIQELFRRGYATVCAAYFEENPASGRVMEKSGMHPIAREDYIEYRGRQHRCLYCEISSPFRFIGSHILYLPASQEPLSAEVYFIQGKKGNYLFDVGNMASALLYIRALPTLPVAILSHHHADHSGNAAKADFAEIYVGDFTQSKLNLGTVVDVPLTIEDGITVIPCPSVHTPGSLILNVYGEYCLIGDLFYCKPPVSLPLARQMIHTLSQVDTCYFVASHGGMERIYPKEAFIMELKKELL